MFQLFYDFKKNGDFNHIIECTEMKTISINEEECEYYKIILKQLGNINEIV